jgi:hypothetical protein
VKDIVGDSGAVRELSADPVKDIVGESGSVRELCADPVKDIVGEIGAVRELSVPSVMLCVKDIVGESGSVRERSVKEVSTDPVKDIDRELPREPLIDSEVCPCSLRVTEAVGGAYPGAADGPAAGRHTSPVPPAVHEQTASPLLAFRLHVLPMAVSGV